MDENVTALLMAVIACTSAVMVVLTLKDIYETIKEKRARKEFWAEIERRNQNG